MASRDYWQEAVEIAFDEAGITATPEQIRDVADAMDGSHECFSMAYPTPENPLIGECAELRRKLNIERDKVVCPTCKGSCVERTSGGTFVSTTRCFRCNGEGKVTP